MILYLAGPMSGVDNFNYEAFRGAAEYLRSRDFIVVSPAEADEDDGGVVDGVATMSWVEYLRRDLRLLLDVDGVATLPGWRRSRGARLEVHVARELGLPHYHLIQDNRTGGWNVVLIEAADETVHHIPSATD